jgi:hypothetical protein
MSSDDPFGGIAVILSRDPAQLSPIGSKSIWDIHQDQPHDKNVYCEYFRVTSVVELTEIIRVDPIDPDAVHFPSLLDRMRDGTCTEEDWLLLCERCTLDSGGGVVWNKRGF